MGKVSLPSGGACRLDWVDLAQRGGKNMAKVNPIKLQKALGGVNYPASKEDLVKHAEGKDADDDVLSFLRNLPDHKYETPADVNKEMS